MTEVRTSCALAKQQACHLYTSSKHEWLVIIVVLITSKTISVNSPSSWKLA